MGRKLTTKELERLEKAAINGRLYETIHDEFPDNPQDYRQFLDDLAAHTANHEVAEACTEVSLTLVQDVKLQRQQNELRAKKVSQLHD